MEHDWSKFILATKIGRLVTGSFASPSQGDTGSDFKGTRRQKIGNGKMAPRSSMPIGNTNLVLYKILVHMAGLILLTGCGRVQLTMFITQSAKFENNL